jgi:signal transduction histidine kinase/DNA-binding NarL/FixJ family response regulator
MVARKHKELAGWWGRQYHGPAGPLAAPDARRQLALLHAFTGVGLVSILFFGVQLVLRGNFLIALVDGVVGSLMAVNLLLARWTRRPLPFAVLGMVLIGGYLWLQVLTGGDRSTGFIWTFLFPPVAVFLLGHRLGLVFQLGYLLALGAALAGGALEHLSGLPADFPVKLMGSLLLVSAFSYAFERSRYNAQRRMLAEVSAHRETERALRRAKEAAEQAVQLKGQFLANVSHELRTPLNGVLGLIDLTLAEQLPPTSRRELGLARQAAHDLLGLLNEILDLSKAEAGKLELHREPVDLRRLVADLVELHRGARGDRRLEIETRVDPQVPAGVCADVGRLRQVLNNLLGNAVKFTGQGRVRLSIAPQPEDAPGGGLRFEVSDTGPGVAAEQRDRIFEPFVQIDGSDARHHGGTGLGLAICRRLVEAMGGRIGYRPAEDGGSVFWFDLALEPAAPPAAEADRPAQQRSAAAAAERRSRRGRVLVVEDNPINALVAERMLEHLGARVDRADDGPQALERWSPGSHDLVLMDCQMPGMDGFEVTAAMRGRETAAGQRVPIVALTAHAMPGDRERCLDAGMDDYLSKPMSQRDLERMLHRWVDATVDHPAEPVKPAASGPGATDAAPPAGGQDRVLDRRRARRRDDPALERALHELFLRTAPGQIDALATALQAADLPAVERGAHQLRGSCATLGAMALDRELELLEGAAASGRTERAAEALEGVRARYAELERELEADEPS